MQEIHKASIRLNALAIMYTNAISEGTGTDDAEKLTLSLGYLETMTGEIAKLKWRVSDQLNNEG